MYRIACVLASPPFPGLHVFNIRLQNAGHLMAHSNAERWNDIIWIRGMNAGQTGTSCQGRVLHFRFAGVKIAAHRFQPEGDKKG